jgi:hypothetical protein
VIQITGDIILVLATRGAGNALKTTSEAADLTRLSVDDKLARYLLNPTHIKGALRPSGSKKR